jgi:hypothetical protein
VLICLLNIDTDIVSFEIASSYIEQALSHFETQSYKAVRKTWNRLEEMVWAPGQASKQLAQALGLAPRPKRRRQKPK